MPQRIVEEAKNTMVQSRAASVATLEEFGMAILQQTELFQRLNAVVDRVTGVFVAVIDAFTVNIGDTIAGFFGLGDSADRAAKALKRIAGTERLGGIIEQAVGLGFDPGTGEELGEFFRQQVVTMLENVTTPEQGQRILDAMATQLENLQDELLAQQVAMVSDPEKIKLLEQAIEQISNAIESGGDILENTVEEMAGAMLNVPEGFKVALRSFQSTDADGGVASLIPSWFGTSDAVSSRAGTRIERQFVIENMNVYSQTPDELALRVSQNADWGSIVKNGAKSQLAYRGVGG
jgi:hypothetical protein